MALLERISKQETLPHPSTRTRLARAALKLLEGIPRSPRQSVDWFAATEAPTVKTGRHRIKDAPTKLTVERLQDWLAVEERRKEDFDTSQFEIPQQKQTVYELATKDRGNHVLVAPEPETTSEVITFTSKDESLLNSVHKNT